MVVSRFLPHPFSSTHGKSSLPEPIAPLQFKELLKRAGVFFGLWSGLQGFRGPPTRDMKTSFGLPFLYGKPDAAVSPKFQLALCLVPLTDAHGAVEPHLVGSSQQLQTRLPLGAADGGIASRGAQSCHGNGRPRFLTGGVDLKSERFAG